MRRDDLARRGVQLPVLPTIVRGALPAGPGWADRLARIGLDVVSTGRAHDDGVSISVARAEAPHRPLLARGDDAPTLAAHGAALVEGSGADGDDHYVLGPDEAMVVGVQATEEEESVMEVARTVLAAAQAGVPSQLWVAAGPGLEALPAALVETKLAALVEGARQARLYLAKEQFDT